MLYWSLKKTACIMYSDKNYHKPDAFSTIEPLNYVLRHVGLSSITRYKGKIQYSWSNSKITLIISLLSIASICNIYIKINSFMSPGVLNFYNSIQVFQNFSYFQLIIDIYFVYKHRQDYLEYYSLYEYIDRVLGMPRYTQIRSSVFKMCSLYILVASVYILVDYIAWAIDAGWIKSIIYFVDYFYVILKVISALDMISHCIQVLFRLKRIGYSLEVLFKSDDFKLGGWNAAKKINRLDSLKIVCYNRGDVILWLRRCYLLLLEQCDFINTSCGFRVLVNNFMFLFDMVMLMNLTIRQMMATVGTNQDVRFISIVSTLMRIFNSLCILLSGMNRCEQCYRETEKIISLIDDLIINNKTGAEERDSLKDLKYLIITRPVKFKAMNFYRLDYPCFVSVASVIITYTIILLQSLK